MRAFLPEVFAALLAAVIVIFGLGVPLMDDDLFWWTPKAIMVVEAGPGWIFAGDLPQALSPEMDLPRQWADGIPDYGHPPLWFLWLGACLKLFGVSATSVHLAVLPCAVATGWGLAALMRRLGGQRAAWGALAVLMCPPVVVQFWRADTDVGLLALSTWALVALVDGRWGRFAVIAALACWVKEPGVLLLVPAVVACLLERRWRWQAVVPLAALLAWGLVHWFLTGWVFAGAERTPDGVFDWISDLFSVAWLVLGDQGRILIWPFVVWAIWRGVAQRRGIWVVGSFTVAQMGFFGSLNFLGGIDREDTHTHVRYLGPGIVSGGAVGIATNPWAAIPVGLTSLWYLKKSHPRGPEASLCGAETALALQSFHRAELSLDAPLWVGSYAFTQLTRPYAGVVDEPHQNLRVFGPETDPKDVEGYVLHGTFGEPLGRLQELSFQRVGDWKGECGWVALERVVGHVRPAPASVPTVP